MGSRDDRRLAERIDTDLPAEYRHLDDRIRGLITDLSEGGLFIETRAPLPAGSQVYLQFTVPGDGEPTPVSVIAEVVRSDPTPADNPRRGMGLRIRTVFASRQDLLRDFVERHRGGSA